MSTEDEDPLLRMGDLRVLYCSDAIRRVFAEAGLDLADAALNGIRASRLRGIGYDAALDRAIESKRERESHRG